MTREPLLVFALENEAQGLFDDCDVLFTGVGKVNASYALTKALHERPNRHVFNFGSAGSSSFPAGGLVNPTAFIQRDMDVRPLGFAEWETPFDEGEPVLTYGERLPGLPEAICGTGDHFDVSGVMRGYNIVDMEAYALAKICLRESTPLTCVKFISDGADGAAHQDWAASLLDGARKLRDLFDGLQARSKE